MTLSDDERLVAVAKRAAARLKQRQAKIVFAESCTAGLIAATLSQTPGISAHLCGSWVTYRESLKTEALGVDPTILSQHSAVSAETTKAMVGGALQRSSEATLALAITGHLGPNAPEDLDGVVFIACQAKGTAAPTVKRFQLESTSRSDRQREAALQALVELNSWIDSREVNR